MGCNNQSEWFITLNFVYDILSMYKQDQNWNDGMTLKVCIIITVFIFCL